MPLPKVLYPFSDTPVEKMGFTNITYKAYEIDKYAMNVATYNYPDIEECGDVFQVRNDDWEY